MGILTAVADKFDVTFAQAVVAIGLIFGAYAAVLAAIVGGKRVLAALGEYADNRAKYREAHRGYAEQRIYAGASDEELEEIKRDHLEAGGDPADLPENIPHTRESGRAYTYNDAETFEDENGDIWDWKGSLKNKRDPDTGELLF